MIRRIAQICLATGALLLSFVAYQLWGTALYEHHAQSVLGLELRNNLGLKPDTGSQAQSASSPPSSTQTFTNKVAPTIAAPPVGQPIGFMTIPRLGMTNDAIVEGAGEAQLQEGPGHYTGTALPGEAGNTAIAGHRTTYAHPFYNLNLMQPGDFVYIQTAQGLFSYEVQSSTIVAPTDVTVLDASPVPELTLTTCNPRYSASQRLVVVALLYKSITAASFGSTPTSPTTPTTQPHVSLPSTLAGDGGVSGVGTADQVELGVLWGALTVAVGWLAVIGWRRIERRQWAWAVLAIGVPVTIALLLVCFQHVSLALPETF